jgi:hypothetical protein
MPKFLRAARIRDATRSLAFSATCLPLPWLYPTNAMIGSNAGVIFAGAIFR